MNTKVIASSVGITTENLIKTLPKHIKPVAKYLQRQENKGESLANARFVQDLVTNFGAKAVFSRSLADFADTGFLEMLENALVYYCPTFFGEKIFRKAYAKKLPPDLAKKVATPLVELAKDKNVSNEALSKIKPVKAAIALSSMLIPLTEFTLNYFKNLFTLKVFKQADFNNIANLDKNKKHKIEDKDKQRKVKKSAHKNILKAAGVFMACIAGSILLAKKGQNSKMMQKFSDIILSPGNVFCKNNEKLRNTVNKYFSMDFAQNNGKLALGHGQLTACVLIGGLGYFGASKDRGRQNLLETAFRYPLVGFSVITGSELIESGFKKLLKNKEGYKNIINKDMSVKAFSELPEIAKTLAQKNNSNINTEFGKLCTKKALIPLGPYLFNLLIMGLFVAGVSRFFTQFRYNKEHKPNQKNQPLNADISMESFMNSLKTKQANNPFQMMQD